MKSTGWIKFTNKLPYSAIDDRTPAYDFPILVALKVGQRMSYQVSTAKEATHIYSEFTRTQECFKAWRPIEEYEESRS